MDSRAMMVKPRIRREERSVTEVKIFVVIASIAGVVYGLYRISRKKMPQYCVMVMSGVGCAAMGRSFELLQQLLSGISTAGFQIGILGVVGSILFLFAANQELIRSEAECEKFFCGQL